MKITPGTFCPLIQADCKGLDCSWFTQVRGHNPNTGEDVDEWGCAITWLPMLMIENSQQQRSTGAAVESFRNEMVNAQQASQQVLLAAAKLNPTNLGGIRIMRVTVIPADRWIRRDDDAANLPEWPFDDASMHAIQWYGEDGEIEYTGRPKPPNEVFTDATPLGPYLAALDQYLIQKAEEEAAALAAAEAAAAQAANESTTEEVTP